MQRCKKYFSIINVLIILALIMQGLPSYAKKLSDKILDGSEAGDSLLYEVKDNYAKILDSYAKNGYTEADTKEAVALKATDFFAADGESLSLVSYLGENDVFLWDEETSEIKVNVKIPATGLYSMRMKYSVANTNTATIVRGIKIDDVLPFDEASSVSLFRKFKDDGKPLINKLGDEISPGVMQPEEWIWQDIYDGTAKFDEPLKFYFTQGTHTITLAMVEQPIYFSSLELFSPEKLASYAEKEAEYFENGYKNAASEILFEAENVLHKNSGSLRMSYSGDPAASPQKTGNVVMNVIGGTSWQNGNSSVTYSFKAKEAGLYKLGIRLIQDYREGLPSYRTIEIDGNIPFKEFKAYKFSYNKKWQNHVVSDGDGNPYLVYLDEGDHTLTLKVCQGELSEITDILTSDSEQISNLILKIRMITGQYPDMNYDYKLTQKIPGIIDELKSVISNMRICMEIMENVSGNRPSKYYQMEGMIFQLEKMIKDPIIIPKRMDDLNTILTTYGDWIAQFQQHPLMMDYIEFKSPDKKIKHVRSTFFQKAYSSLVNFIQSFFKDYNLVSTFSDNVESEKVLNIWVGRGKDWCTIIEETANRSFVKETGVGVNISVLPAGQLNSGSANALLLAIASERAPDIALAVPSTSVGEFALRNAVVDITKMEGFDQVKNRFTSQLFIPLSIKDKIYGLPETQSFSCLIYRKDILSQLSLSVPNTWDEVRTKVIPVLNQNNMQFYINSALIDSFNMFLFQNNGVHYTEDGSASALDSPEAYRAFKEYTDMFSVYGVPVSANLFNRFRTGEMPIGVGSLADYMQIIAAAPELKGKWGIALIPGKMDSGGEVSRAHTGIIGESAVILSQSKLQKEAWSFIEWWTRKDVQQSYGNEIEAMHGETARWSSANMEAFVDMNWKHEDLLVIKKTFDEGTQIPVVLGGYFTTRHISNAFNRTAVSGINARKSLEEAVKDINRELKRRAENAGENK